LKSESVPIALKYWLTPTSATPWGGYKSRLTIQVRISRHDASKEILPEAGAVRNFIFIQEELLTASSAVLCADIRS
jgi:hypothetical protein